MKQVLFHVHLESQIWLELLFARRKQTITAWYDCYCWEAVIMMAGATNVEQHTALAEVHHSCLFRACHPLRRAAWTCREQRSISRRHMKHAPCAAADGRHPFIKSIAQTAAVLALQGCLMINGIYPTVYSYMWFSTFNPHKRTYPLHPHLLHRRACEAGGGEQARASARFLHHRH